MKKYTKKQVFPNIEKTPAYKKEMARLKMKKQIKGVSAWKEEGKQKGYWDYFEGIRDTYWVAKILKYSSKIPKAILAELIK